jgi:hypothetical protein
VVERIASPFTREALGKRKCTQCHKEGMMLITITKYGNDVVVGEYCSMECELRSRGIPIKDMGVELLLENALRGGDNGTRTEAIKRV